MLTYNQSLKPTLAAIGLLCAALIVCSGVRAEEPITQSCPDRFGALNIHSDARLCQVFEASSRSAFRSINYFVALSPNEVVAYYQKTHPSLRLHSHFNRYRMLTMANTTTRIVISDDAQGTQVNMLMDAAPNTD